MKVLSHSDNILLRLDYFLSKQEAAEAPVPGIEREEPLEGPEAGQFEIEDKPITERAGEDPTGKVQTKIYELVHRGGRTFERARTAWVNPDVAAQLEQRKRASDWIRTLGNYLPIYFVGGYVRDKFFKKVSKDIDLVALVSLDEAKKTLTKLNIAFKEKNNSHARLQFEVGGMKVDLISTTPEDLLDNLRSRDFTINAVAQSVTGQFYDPTRGMEDVKLKLLRSPNNDSVKSFREDPARILRGARFLADFPIKAHPSILKGLKANADALSKLKKRRIGFELVKLMQTEKSWVAMQFLADNDQLKFICPDLVELTETKQRGKNHKQSNVWKHTMATLKHASSTDEILNLAILFHDIGKSQTATDDNKHFPDHDKKGAEMTTRILTELGLPKDVVKRVSNMVEHHLFIGKVGPKGDAEEYKKLALALGGDIDRFFKLSEADAKDHKEYDPSWLDTAHKRLKKIKGTKPKQAGTEELQKQGQMGPVNRGQRVDQQPGMVQGRRQGMPPPITPEGRNWQSHRGSPAQSQSREYDPKGKHVGERGGRYLLPGERETGGKQVEVVQAPEPKKTGINRAVDIGNISSKNLTPAQNALYGSIQIADYEPVTRYGDQRLKKLGSNFYRIRQNYVRNPINDIIQTEGQNQQTSGDSTTIDYSFQNSTNPDSARTLALALLSLRQSGHEEESAPRVTSASQAKRPDKNYGKADISYNRADNTDIISFNNRVITGNKEDASKTYELHLPKTGENFLRVKTTGTEELKKYQQSLLDESIELLLIDEMFEKADDDSKDYDPKGFHVGPREGHYFKPGERETGGKQVEIVQAPEATPELPSEYPKRVFDNATEQYLRVIVPDNPDVHGVEPGIHSLKQPHGPPVRGKPISIYDSRIPDTVYHMTTNATAVRESKKLIAGGVGGLGGDDRDKIVSLTINKEIAHQLVEDTKLASEIGRMGGGEYKSPERIKESRAIIKRLIQEMEKEGWDGPRFREYDDDHFEYMHESYNPKEWLSQYFSVRSGVTSRLGKEKLNPLFFTDSETLAKINPENIDVIEIPKNALRTGAMITDLDLDNPYGLQEIRIYGDVGVPEAKTEIDPNKEENNLIEKSIYSEIEYLEEMVQMVGVDE